MNNDKMITIKSASLSMTSIESLKQSKIYQTIVLINNFVVSRHLDFTTLISKDQ